MAYTQRPIRPIEIDFTCDSCGEGKMRPTGVMLCSNPPQFPHTCINCGAEQTFREKYPMVRYALEGELIDIENYQQSHF